MSGKKEGERSQRSSALADKKRRLEELKARRSNRQLQQQQQDDTESVTSSSLPSTTTATAASASEYGNRAGNLDDYIDGLLNSTLPIGAPINNPTSTSATPATSALENTIPIAEAIPLQSNGAISNDAATNNAFASTSSSSQSGIESKYPEASIEATIVQQPKVETFEICTQTEEDDFIIDSSDRDNNDNNKDTVNDGQDTEITTTQNNEQKQDDETKPKETKKAMEPTLLTEVEVKETISSNEFTTFFNSASKKVERLLGSSILSDLLVDDMMYYTDLQSKRNDSSSKSRLGISSHSLISKQILFEYPKWTKGRDITSMDWSAHHRGEVFLSSYHMRNSSVSSSISSTAISSIGTNLTPSSSLLPTSRSEMIQADGLTILWNLTMPKRPEHILTCGSPVLHSKFHPTEGNLVVGACYSGQVVVWDVRSGRLPVQRSSLNLIGENGNNNNNNGGGHVHPVVGLEVLDGGAGFVTAASDGIVNFWSLQNLIEPAESLKISGANLTSIVVAPGTQSIVAADECGSMYAIVSSSATSTTTRSASSSITSRRTIRKFNVGDTDSDGLGHYGPVTGLSTKAISKKERLNGISMSRGFASDVKGMMLSCGVDWTTKLWAPAYSDTPLLNLLSHSYDYMSDVQWSPVHPSIFCTASSNGSLSFWNLATSIDEPVTGLTGITVEKKSDLITSQRSLNKVRWSADGRRIAAACSDSLYVLALSEELWRANGDEEGKLMNNLKSRGLLSTKE